MLRAPRRAPLNRTAAGPRVPRRPWHGWGILRRLSLGPRSRPDSRLARSDLRPIGNASVRHRVVGVSAEEEPSDGSHRRPSDPAELNAQRGAARADTAASRHDRTSPGPWKGVTWRTRLVRGMDAPGAGQSWVSKRAPWSRMHRRGGCGSVTSAVRWLCVASAALTLSARSVRIEQPVWSSSCCASGSHANDQRS
jgi:hypothetical protein